MTNSVREELEGIIATRVRQGCEQFSKLINGKVSESSYKTEWLKLDATALTAIEKVIEDEKQRYVCDALLVKILKDHYITREEAVVIAKQLLQDYACGSLSDDDDKAIKTAFNIKEDANG